MAKAKGKITSTKVTFGKRKGGKASKTQLFFSMRQGKESIDVESDIMH